MKKIMLFVLAVLMSGAGWSDGLGDQISASLISHVSTHAQWTTKGEQRLALLTDIVEVGKWKGSAVGQLRFGFTGITNPDSTVTPGAGYVADAYINIAPFIRQYVTLNPAWQFLTSVEAGPSLAYDFREHHSLASFSVGLAFSLNPRQ